MDPLDHAHGKNKLHKIKDKLVGKFNHHKAENLSGTHSPDVAPKFSKFSYLLKMEIKSLELSLTDLSAAEKTETLDKYYKDGTHNTWYLMNSNRDDKENYDFLAERLEIIKASRQHFKDLGI